MSRPQKAFVTARRGDTKTFQLTLNPVCGLPARVCSGWRRQSFQNLPDELAQFRNPKTKNAADAGAFALIEYLKKKLAENNTRSLSTDDTTVGQWVKMFTSMETSPRTARNAARNRPYSQGTLDTYASSNLKC